jgi:hypothetical protein
MKVNIPNSTDKTPTAEMATFPSGEMGYVAEMVTEPAKLKDFGFGDDIVQKANALKEASEDNKPEFPVVRVEEGWSESGRLYVPREIDSIVAQTNELEPVGHLGHIPDDKISTAFPDPQTTWIGAVAKTELSQDKKRTGEMVRVAYFAGYNLPGAKIRSFIKSRVVRGISWWGRANQIPIPGKGVEIEGFELKALDWARKLAEGMPTSKIVAIAQEMKEGEVAELDLAQVTPEQFKKDNPNGYELLVREVKDENKEQVAEMEAKIEEGDEAKSLLTKTCELLGIKNPDEIEAKVVALTSKVGEKAKATLTTGLDAILAERIPGDDEDSVAKRKLVLRLLPTGEMETKLADSDDDADAKKIISEMVDEAFDNDDTIKTIIGEQQPPVVRRREELRSNAGELDKALEDQGMKRERVTIG